MIHHNSLLYGVRSKKHLFGLLNIRDKKFFTQDHISKQINIYLHDDNKKQRLIEKPSFKLKQVQTRILRLLEPIEIPEFVFSFGPGKTPIDNALFHMRGRRDIFLFKVDINAFFPSIHRDKVYCFFKNELNCSSDVARILTDLTTVNLLDNNLKCDDVVRQFISAKNIKTQNHLITGAPTSSRLAFLTNHDMFSDLYTESEKNGIRMTVYADDVFFSSSSGISKSFRSIVKSIIRKNGYSIANGKERYYTNKEPKGVTGVIIDRNGSLRIKNSLRLKIISELRRVDYQKAPSQRIIGLVNAARMIEPAAFPSVRW